MPIATSIISAIALIIVAVIETGNRRKAKQSEDRALRREEEARLSMAMSSATLDLAYVTSVAVTGGHTNGNVEEAQRKAKKAQEDYQAFIQAQAAHTVAKV